MQETLRKAIEIVRSGGIIIYPTDTAWGIGCRIDSKESVDRLFKIRHRPLSQATPLLVSSITMALAYYSRPSTIVRRLMERYWPGGLTIVAPCKTHIIYSPIRGAGKTIGLRMPDHRIPLAVIRGVGVPIIGCSANFSGQRTAHNLEDLDSGLVALVDMVVPGKCRGKIASTVVDCSIEPYTILRRGAVKLRSSFELSIDASSSDTKVIFLINNQRFVYRSHVSMTKAQVILPLLDNALRKHHKSIYDVTGITVHTGPGSYTGLRVAAAIANTLGILLSVPVNGRAAGRAVDLQYGNSDINTLAVTLLFLI